VIKQKNAPVFVCWTPGSGAILQYKTQEAAEADALSRLKSDQRCVAYVAKVLKRFEHQVPEFEEFA